MSEKEKILMKTVHISLPEDLYFDVQELGVKTGLKVASMCRVLITEAIATRNEKIGMQSLGDKLKDMTPEQWAHIMSDYMTSE